MERLTEKEQYDGKVCFTKCAQTNCPDKCAFCYIPDKANVKLKEYEDSEEQGLLVRLPCKVGDTLYRLDNAPLFNQREIVPYVVDNILLSGNGEILFKYDAYDGIICDLKSLITGEPYLDYYRVFLTSDQAEQTLKEMESTEIGVREDARNIKFSIQ